MLEGDETSSHGATEHEEATIGDEPSVSAKSERGVAGSITEPAMIPEARQQRLQQIEQEQADLQVKEGKFFQQVLDTRTQVINPLEGQDKARYDAQFVALAKLHYAENFWSDTSAINKASKLAEEVESMIHTWNGVLLNSLGAEEFGKLISGVDRVESCERLATVFHNLAAIYSKYIDLETEKKKLENDIKQEDINSDVRESSLDDKKEPIEQETRVLAEIKKQNENALTDFVKKSSAVHINLPTNQDQWAITETGNFNTVLNSPERFGLVRHDRIRRFTQFNNMNAIIQSITNL